MNSDEKWYEIVAQELKLGLRRDGLWVKALAKSLGDNELAKSLYIELRVVQLMEEDFQKKESDRLIAKKEKEREKLQDKRERKKIFDEYLSAREKLGKAPEK